MLQAQADFIEASSALTDKTEAVSVLNIEVEQLRREPSLKQQEASGAAAAQDHAALQQQVQVQLQQQRLQQVQAELQRQKRCGVALTCGKARNQLGSPASTQPG